MYITEQRRIMFLIFKKIKSRLFLTPFVWKVAIKIDANAVGITHFSTILSPKTTLNHRDKLFGEIISIFLNNERENNLK